MKDILKIAVCEDQKNDAERVMEMIKKSSFEAQCTWFQSGEELLGKFSSAAFDLILIDIYMQGKMTGVETVTRIRKENEKIPVAFVTNSTDFALEGYRLSVVRYIEKPCREKDIEDILRIARLEKDSAPSLSIHLNKKEEKIPFSQILYLEQQTHQVNIYMLDGTREQVYDKLSNFLPSLEENDFIQPHKSFAVNLNFVRSIDTELKCFKMQNGSNVPIRRESVGKARKALENFLFSRTRRLSQ